MKPNLFSIATKELSQDAFITWLLQWADDSFIKENSELCNAGKEFAKKLLSFKYKIETKNIKKVNAGRQWANIDIWAEVNDEYVIIIEDKVNTSEHDDQLERYKKTVEDEYGKDIKLVCIYLKTGLETMDNVQKIKDKDWNYISRKDFIDFLKSQNPQSEIYSDYLENLMEIQTESESFTRYEQLNSWEATKGLYSFIESKLENDWSQWDYVPNANGGFLGLWFHFTPLASEKNCELYLQIENYCADKINLFIKICGEWERTTDTLYYIFDLIQEKSREFDLNISKPARYKCGEYTSVAIVNDVFIKKKNGDLDLKNLIDKLNRATELINSITSEL